jgi:hypothetical protein
MMINCPNCNLLQPKDQYCASCGINMETWKAPEPPLWKRFLSNWMFQLALLFIVIFVVVLKDNLTEKKEITSLKNSVPVAANIPREEYQNFEDTPAPEVKPQVLEPEVSQAKGTINLKSLKPEPVESIKSSEIKKIANLKIFLMNQNTLFQMTEKSQKLTENAYIVPLSVINEVLDKNKNRTKSFGNVSSDFIYNKEKVLFVGEEDLDTGLKIGLFAAINSLPHIPGNLLQYEFSYWSQLHLNKEPMSRINLDVAAPLKTALVFIDPTINEMNFSKEEQSLFESSDRLNNLNNEAFVEGQSDIVLVLEIK